MRPLPALLLPLVLLTSSAALAAAPRLPSVAVLDVRSTGTFDPKTVAGLSSFLPIEAARHRVRVVSGSDVRALLGFEKERQLLGCTETSCIAEIGGALGTEYLLSSEVAEVGGVWLLTFSLLDLARGHSVERVAKRTTRTAELVDLAAAGVAEALARFDAPRAEPAAVQATAAPEGGGVRTAGFVVGAAGLAALAGGGVTGYLAQTSYSQGQDAVKAGDAAALATAKEDARTRMLAANVLYGVGAAAVGAGVLMVLLGGPSTPVTLAPIPGGAAVTFQGGF